MKKGAILDKKGARLTKKMCKIGKKIPMERSVKLCRESVEMVKKGARFGNK